MIKHKLKARTIIALLSILTPALFLTSSTNAYKVDTFDVPTPSSLAGSLTKSSDNKVWFTKPREKKIVRTDTLGNMVEFDIPQIDQKEVDLNTIFGSMASDDEGGIIFTSNDRGSSQTTRSGYVRKVSSNGQFSSIQVTIPETSINSSITPSRMGLFIIEYSNSNTYWVIGGSLEDGYTIVMKVNASGVVSDYWESDIEEGGLPRSLLDTSGNLWVSLKGKLLKISHDGQESLITLSNMQNIVNMVLDDNNDIWVGPWSQDYSGTTTPLAKINHLNNEVSYFQLPQGRTVLPLIAMSKGPDGYIWLGTMDTMDTMDSDQNSIKGLDLSRLSLAGILTNTNILKDTQALTSLVLDKSNNLWALSTDIDNNSDEGFVPNSVKLTRISLDETDNPPQPPKTGNTAIFILITSLVVSSVLLFGSYIHQKHIKTIVTTK